MKEAKQELKKEAQVSSSKSNTENLAEAVKWVYQRYGTDLPAFFEDAYKDVTRKQQERTADDNTEVCPL
jgi:hypothetical protein